MRPATMQLMRNAQGFPYRSFIIIISSSSLLSFFARQTMDGYKKKLGKTEKKKRKKQDDYEQRTLKKFARGHLSGLINLVKWLQNEIFQFFFSRFLEFVFLGGLFFFFFLRAGFVPGILMRDSVVQCCCRSVQYVR